MKEQAHKEIPHSSMLVKWSELAILPNWDMAKYSYFSGAQPLHNNPALTEDRWNERMTIEGNWDGKWIDFRLSCQNETIGGMGAVISGKNGEAGGSVSATSAKKGRLMERL